VQLTVDVDLDHIIEQVVAEVLKRVKKREAASAQPSKPASLLRYEQVGARLGRSYEGIKAMVKRKQLRSVKSTTDRRSFIDSRDVDDSIRRQTGRPL
jgi:hypothetical protein